MRQTIKISAPKLNTLKLTGELRKTVPKISYSEGIHMYTRVIPILQKLRYLKDQVMWSNTLLWGMFIPIFKLLPLKLRSRWNAQFYEAISLNFHLIKYSDA